MVYTAKEEDFDKAWDQMKQEFADQKKSSSTLRHSIYRSRKNGLGVSSTRTSISELGQRLRLNLRIET